MAKKSKQTGLIPEHELEALARCLLPEILAFYETKEGQQEFKKWKAVLHKDKTMKKGFY